MLEEAAAQVLLELPHHETRQAALLLRPLEKPWPVLAHQRVQQRLLWAAPRVLALNAAAIPSGLVERELFDHEAGAFSDAREAAPGAVERAEGGTLFLDEVGDLAPEAQAKLLRFLEAEELPPRRRRR